MAKGAFIAIGLVWFAGCATTDARLFSDRVRDHSTEVSRCYVQVLHEDRAARGEIDLSVTVDGEGRVLSVVTARNTFPDSRVADCVAGVIRGIAFPAGGQNRTTTFSYPVSFSIEEGSRPEGGKP